MLLNRSAVGTSREQRQADVLLRLEGYNVVVDQNIALVSAKMKKKPRSLWKAIRATGGAA